MNVRYEVKWKIGVMGKTKVAPDPFKSLEMAKRSLKVREHIFPERQHWIEKVKQEVMA